MTTEQSGQFRTEWFRVTLARIGDAVITTDAEGRVTFLNPDLFLDIDRGSLIASSPLRQRPKRGAADSQASKLSPR